MSYSRRGRAQKPRRSGGASYRGLPIGIFPQWGPAFDPDTGEALPHSDAGFFTADAPSYQPHLALRGRSPERGPTHIPMRHRPNYPQLGVGDWSAHHGAPFGFNPGSMGHHQLAPMLALFARLLEHAPAPTPQQISNGVSPSGGATKRMM